MRKALLAAPIALILVAQPRPAEAKIFEIWGSALAGGAYGNGKTNKDFFNWAGGGAAGVEVGAKVLFISAYVDYLRFFGGDTGANLIGFNLGGDGTVGLVGGLGLVLRLAGTFYIGTLDDDDARPDGTTTNNVQTRGVGVRGGVGLRYSFWKVFSIGVTPQIGYHYFFGGADDDALTDNSHGWDFSALGYFRVGLGF